MSYFCPQQPQLQESNILSYLENLTNYCQKNNKLALLQNIFKEKLGVQVCCGAEIEFYLDNRVNKSLFTNLLRYKINLELHEEKGNNQFEINLPPNTDLTLFAKNIDTTKSLLQLIASRSGGEVIFAAKPFPNDYGSSMHIHLSFTPYSSVLHIPSATTRNKVFLEKCAQAICYYTLDCFIVFAPNAEDYKRFCHEFMAPTHISYGDNNRSVLVRIPDQVPTRLEHRLSSPRTDPYLAITFILLSILKGLQHPENLHTIKKIYGNAFDPQYSLQPLPSSIGEAIKCFNDKMIDF